MLKIKVSFEHGFKRGHQLCKPGVLGHGLPQLRGLDSKHKSPMVTRKDSGITRRALKEDLKQQSGSLGVNKSHK